MLESVFNKVLEPSNLKLYQKETPIQVFCSEYCENLLMTVCETSRKSPAADDKLNNEKQPEIRTTTQNNNQLLLQKNQALKTKIITYAIFDFLFSLL